MLKHIQFLLLAALITMPRPAAADWPCYRGPNGDGTCPDAQIRTDWKATPPKIAWRADVGFGFSEVVVAGNRALTAGYDVDSKTSAVFCFDLESGALTWKQAYADTCGGERKSLLGPIATPTVDGDRVYMVAAMGTVYCFDLASGAPIWEQTVNKDKDQGIPFGDYGDGVSALVVDDLVIAHLSTTKDSAAWSALRKADGSPVWSHPVERRQAARKRAIIDRSYCAPVRCELNGKPHLILVANAVIDCVELASGARTATHSLADLQLDYGPFAPPVLTGADTFFLTFWYARRENAVLFRIAGDGLARVWANRTLGKGAYSYVVRDGHVYGFGAQGLQGVNLADGDLKWKWRDSDANLARDQGEIILLGDKLVWISTSGRLYVGEASPANRRPLADLQVIGPRPRGGAGATALYNNIVCTAPSFSAGRLFCRSPWGEVVCVDLR
ncbi:MAG: PQQ-binding-like beta-propeller repeat protein [Kiritimatiellae bacterium]|nr:PQQ-binding-like beta-propeller repeat protein [Kiritimatiellia bacterium]